MKKRVSIFGVTGCIGQKTAELIDENLAAYEVIAISAQKNAAGLIDAAKRLKPQFAVIGDENLYAHVKTALSASSTKVLAGETGLLEAAKQPTDWLMAAIVGVAGLKPMIAALPHAKAIALANKEALVAGGNIFLHEAAKHGVQLIPTDSEHSGLFQLLQGVKKQAVRKLILTASGGPFRDSTLKEMAQATPAQALRHPTWKMGDKISVDSATMMNKGLEVIEAHYLFGFDPAKIEVLLHYESIIHAMLQLEDGTALSQMAVTDMKAPIAYALHWPETYHYPGGGLDFAKLGRFTFAAPDEERFPALRLSRSALEAGPASIIVLNAANEIAVERFLNGEIGFLDIVRLVETSLGRKQNISPQRLEDVQEIDTEARIYAKEWQLPVRLAMAM